MQKIVHQQSPEVLPWENFAGPGLIWSDLQRNRAVKGKTRGDSSSSSTTSNSISGSKPRHCWLGDRKGIRPVKHWVLFCWW